MNRRMTAKLVIDIIRSKGEFVVNRYGERDEKARKLTRRMYKDGRLQLWKETSDRFIYKLVGQS